MTTCVGIEDGLPAARLGLFLSRWIDRDEEVSRHFAGNALKRPVVSLRLLVVSLSPLPSPSNVPNKYNERLRTGSTGRDSALNGPFTNFDVSTYVSFQTFYEVVDRAAAPYADPNLTPRRLFQATTASRRGFSL